MQPSPRAETSRLLFPSLRFCMLSLRRVLGALDVSELAALGGTPQHERAPTHVASPDELRGKRSRGPSTAFSGSRYLGVAMLPSRTAASDGCSPSASRAASRRNGRV